MQMYQAKPSVNRYPRRLVRTCQGIGVCFFQSVWRIFCGIAAKNQAFRFNLLAAPKGFPLQSFAPQGLLPGCMGDQQPERVRPALYATFGLAANLQA
jgi:hypothetical protein